MLGIRAGLERLRSSGAKLFVDAATPGKQLRLQGRPATITYASDGSMSSLVARKPIFNPSGATKEARARAFVAAFPEFFALDASDALVYFGERKRAGARGHYVRFRQSHAGVPCAGTNLTVLLDAQGRVEGFFANLRHDISAGPSPSVGAKVAEAGALLSGQTLAKGAMLEYVRDDGSARLAWRVDVQHTAKKERWRTWVDAHSGKVVRRVSLRRHALNADEISLAVDSVVQRRTSPEYFCGCCETPTSPENCNYCLCMDSGTYGAELATIWAGASAASRYWAEKLDRDGADGNGGYLLVNYDPSYGDGAFTEEDRVTIGSNAIYADVVVHELGHAQMYYDGEPEYFAESMGVNEGLANTFSLAVYQDDWAIGNGWSAQFPNGHACGAQGAQAASFRFYCFDELGQVDTRYYNGAMVSHPFYLAAVTSSDPVTSCDQDSDCATGDSWVTGHCVCKDGSDSESCGYLGGVGKHCVTEKNSTTVPYRGRDHAYAPFYYALQSGALSGFTRLDEVYGPVHSAAEDYDASLGYNSGEFTGRTITDAFLAAGHWLPQETAVNDPPNQNQAFYRPAFLVNIYPGGVCAAQSPRCPEGATCEGGFCTQESWAQMYLPQPADGSEPGRIMLRSSQNGVAWSGDHTVYFNGGEPMRADSGVAIARNPSADQLPQAVMAFRVAGHDTIQLASATLSATSAPEWTLTSEFGATDDTPAIAYFNNTVMVFWKEAGGEQLRYGSLAEDFHENDVPDAVSSAAPAVTVANGRLWVFFRGGGGGAGDFRLYYTSFDGSQWEPVRSVGTIEPEVLPRTAFRPEVVTYGGAGYTERVWVYWGRYSNIRMFSFDADIFSPPDLSDSSVIKSPPVPLRGTTSTSTSNPWISSFQMNGYLRLYYKHAEVQDAWQTAKRGDG